MTGQLGVVTVHGRSPREKPSVVGTRTSARSVVAFLVAALVGSPCEGVALPIEPDNGAVEVPSQAVGLPVSGVSSAVDSSGSSGKILASALRFASVESHRLARTSQKADAGPGDHRGASVAEKLACLYLLVGGSILLAYGPQEKAGTSWTNDGKAETAGGAAAIVLSLLLFRDIRKQATPPDHR